MEHQPPVCSPAHFLGQDSSLADLSPWNRDSWKFVIAILIIWNVIMECSNMIFQRITLSMSIWCITSLIEYKAPCTLGEVGMSLPSLVQAVVCSSICMICYVIEVQCVWYKYIRISLRLDSEELTYLNFDFSVIALSSKIKAPALLCYLVG